MDAIIYLNVDGLVAIMDEANPKEHHTILGNVLQLRMRREILKYIGDGIKTKTEIENNFGLSETLAELHITLLEKAKVIEKTDDGYRSTLAGLGYLKNCEAFALEPSKKCD